MSLPHSDVRDIDAPSDADLIRAVRTGDRPTYGVVYERHAAAARAHARG